MAKGYTLIIDGQNVDSDYIPAIMAYCASIGRVQARARFYKSAHEINVLLSGGTTILDDHGVDAVSVRCRAGKNSIDVKIAVDLIDYANRKQDFDQVIVATNDSDFTHIASRLIQHGLGFHLLYTGSHAPAGYSPKVKMHRLAPKSAKPVQAKKVAAAPVVT